MQELTFGWEEWVALPELGLPAIKAKIDTGARTSALHAHDIEVFGPASKPKVRFNVHPIPGREDISITCSAPLIDRREVTSSNGETELRFVIETTVAMGGRRWPIEVTLTDRGSMAYRMPAEMLAWCLTDVRARAAGQAERRRKEVAHPVWSTPGEQDCAAGQVPDREDQRRCRRDDEKGKRKTRDENRET